MKNLYGITGIKTIVFSRSNMQEHMDEVNAFLQAHDGDILDIQYSATDYYSELLIVYKDNK